MASIASFECSLCGQHLAPDGLPTVCPADGSPLFVRYNLPLLRETAGPAQPAHLQAQSSASLGLDRFHELLPTPRTRALSGLGEGSTPLLRSRTHPKLFLKDEGRNSCGTLAARGFALAAAMARHYGLAHLTLGTSDPLEATACAAFAAAFGLHAHIVMPRSSSPVAPPTPQLFGAEATLLNAPLEACIASAAELAEKSKGLNLSPGQEPFRLEGTKTLAIEFLEQLSWRSPAAILLPADPIAILATAKALDELSAIGWLGSPPTSTRLFAVASASQATATPLADLALSALTRSGGRLLTVDPGTIRKQQQQSAHAEGLLLSPAGSAVLAAHQALLTSNELYSIDLTVAINPSDGLLSLALDHRRPLPTSLPVGGIITPI